MASQRAVHICIAIVACLLVVSNAADRRRPQPHSDDCPPCQGRDTAPPPGHFEYFVLQKLPSGTLHGLLPQLCNSCTEDFPAACSRDQFDVNSIPQDTLAKMQKEWPSGTGPNEEFWEHEWQCHGTCSGFSLPDFFTNAIATYEQCNQQHCCFTKDLQLVGCHDECPYESSNQGAWELTISDGMLSQAALHNATSAAGNRACKPKSGTCGR